MTDWADEIANRFGCTRCAGLFEPEIAIALRKAKADGMRGAIEILIHSQSYPLTNAMILKFALAVRATADKIEKGQEGMK